MLTRSNFKRWKQDIEFALDIVDMDLALCEDEPPKPHNQSTTDQKAHYAGWENLNRLNPIDMKRSIAEHLISGLPEDTNVRQLLEAVGERYKVSDKAEVKNLLSELMNMRYDAVMDVREFILKMVHIQSKLKAHEIVLSENYIMHHALNVLPTKFSQIKTTYSTQNETWSVNALITKCATE
ncbi:hypothetical protein ACJRO7_005223 [Eucalyptus globulus]|uniref:Uncharacterized protein n=1 Tax=Eucalyptus globulus TaxID=34317 RepID=A0ABD3J2Q9_EUCGL